MNLQTMSIILIIIILPITLVLSAYTQMQIDTIAQQTMYRTKLKDATYDAISAFQINTVHNTYTTVSDSMRRDVSAAIQTFINDLSTNLGVSRTDEINILPYIPATVFTLYDGYYIYSPAISHKIDGTTNVEVTNYEHILKPYIYYTKRYKTEDNNIDVVINYSLDSYIVVTGYIGTDYVTKAGYIVNSKYKDMIKNSEELQKRLPVTTIAIRNNSYNIGKDEIAVDVTNIKVTNINQENSIRLSNGIWLQDDSLFVNKNQLSINQRKLGQAVQNGKVTITEDIILDEINKPVGSVKDYNGYLLKKFVDTDSAALYKGIDIEYDIGFYVDPNLEDYYVDPESAYKFYNGDPAKNEQGALEFTKWVKQYLGDLTPADAVDVDGNRDKDYENQTKKIFDISDKNDPYDQASLFNNHRRDVIRESIQDNLSQTIESYNNNSIRNFHMPILSEEEWDQVLNNVSFITFMQGIQVGTKIFNDYCIVTSTRNKEYVSPNSIYYINSSKDNTDGYYHTIDCPHLKDTNDIVGYRNSEFDRKYYEVDKNNIITNISKEKEKEPASDENRYTITYSKDDVKHYYYMHGYIDKNNTSEEHVYEACYYCIVSQLGSDNRVNNWNKMSEHENRVRAYYTAMAREKYQFYKTNAYFGQE